ncbi:hypothetical protein AMS68_000324 [Peltaster fructicola]|uniref:UspA domain-containing protein n=1 Tax=Peltaster fructicola TaxID=286661 RepID=A0A6H0XJA8_9PEZI|nr:hypothetical protein AMS68_000324 [Peltaster fructicola]
MASTPSPTTKAIPTNDPVPPLSSLSNHNVTTLPDRSTDDNNATTGTTSSAKGAFVPAWRRPTFTTPGATHGRRQSVQFVPHAKETGSRSSSAKPAGASKTYTGPTGRRLSSPPPPAQFRPSVSFDTFANPQASEFSLTLNRKHKEYEYTKRSRTFLCGTDTNEYSDTALEWLIDELVDDGDEVVCLRVVEKDSKEAAKWSGGQGEKGYREEASRFLEGIVKKNTEGKTISLVLEFAIGKVPDTIQQMIRIYEPAILVVGTRGRSLTGYQGLLSSGSVSKYCLQYSPVPVIVVRPSSKRESKKLKRLQDPNRTGYRDILDKSKGGEDGRGGHLLDKQNRHSVTGADLGLLGQLTGAGDPDLEAQKVAEAIGYHPRGRVASREHRSSSLSRMTSARSDNSDLGSPDERVLKSPELRDLDSPDVSDEENADRHTEALPEPLRPEDTAAMAAYERGLAVHDETTEEEAARQQRDAVHAAGFTRAGGRSRSRGRQDQNEEGGGAAVLGLLAQLDRGIR